MTLLETPLLVRIPVACRLIGLSRTEFYRRIAEFRTRKCGRLTLVEYESLVAWRDRLPLAEFQAAA